jgi:hypothetical protein
MIQQESPEASLYEDFREFSRVDGREADVARFEELERRTQRSIELSSRDLPR